MSERSDSELLKIVNELRNDYQVEAVEAAETELKNRNLNSTQIEEAIKYNEKTKQITIEKANDKLGTGWKILTFIFPGIIQVIFAVTFKADGYDRKAKELTKWTLYGFGFYFGFAFLIIILSWLL